MASGVARKRVLRVPRLMREHALLSPHRARSRPAEAHDRKIVTEAPNLMWATDATQVTTVRHGKVWFFAVRGKRPPLGGGADAIGNMTALDRIYVLSGLARPR